MLVPLQPESQQTPEAQSPERYWALPLLTEQHTKTQLSHLLYFHYKSRHQMNWYRIELKHNHRFAFIEQWLVQSDFRARTIHFNRQTQLFDILNQKPYLVSSVYWSSLSRFVGRQSKYWPNAAWGRERWPPCRAWNYRHYWISLPEEPAPMKIRSDLTR